MMLFLNSLLGECHSVNFINSSKLSICDNKRISKHKTFKDLARCGKSSTGWFFFKLYITINHLCKIKAFKITGRDVHDSQVV